MSFAASAQYSSEIKGIDKSDYTITAKAGVASGALTAASPTFTRRYSDGYSATCNKTSFASTTRYYEVFPIYSSTGEALDISTASTSGTTDCHFLLYCDPFDPNNSDLNIKAIDDDGGPGFMPAFLPGNNYMIDANTQYYLVMTTFSSGATGTYDITMGGNLHFGMVPPPPPVPLSNWAFALIGLFAVTFVFIKFRK